MPCYNPTRVVMEGDHRVNFGRDWRFAKLIGNETVINLNCRHCIGCNMARAREWSVRCFHEAQLHTRDWRDVDTGITTEIPNSSCITLTFDDDHLPADQALDHKYFQRFMKRLRNRRRRKLGLKTPVRYLMAGEYGGKTGRPHFHAIIFGHDFADQYKETTGFTMSEELDFLWSEPRDGEYYPTKIGRATLDVFSFSAAAYVAGYVAKKQAETHLGPIEEVVEDGVTRYVPKSPEYTKMSTHPGLGAEWIVKPHNLAAVYSEDVVRINEWKFHPPKYYDKILQETRPDLVADIKLNRVDGISRQSEEWSPERCSAAEQIALADLQRRRDSL